MSPIWDYSAGIITIAGGIGIGTVAAGLIAARSSAATTLAQQRQAWIIGLRAEVVEYLQATDMIQEGAAVELFHNLAVEARTALATKNFRALVLRLNARERRHVRFVRRLRPLMTVMPIAEYRRQVDFVVLVSRLILKREWEVTKRQGSRGWGKGLAKFASRHRRKWHKPRGWQWVYALLAKDQA